MKKFATESSALNQGHSLRVKRYLAPVLILASAVVAFFPFSSYSATNLRSKGTSSIYIEAYVNFIAASTFELFHVMFQLRRLPKGDLGIGTNQNVTDLKSRELLAKVSGASVVIKGVEGEIVQVSCSKEGALSSGFQKMPISDVGVAAGTQNTGDYGEGVQCAGDAAPAISHVITSQSDDNTLFIGARVQVSNKLAAARYTTSNPDGQPVSFEINYI